MIIPEGELEKIPEEKIFSFYCNVMLNPDGDLTEEERAEVWKKIKKYDHLYGSMGISPAYPKATELVERNDIPYKRILMTYLPLCIIVILLFSISVIGMKHGTAWLIAELEMVFNCVMAFMLTVVLFTLQKIFYIVDGMSCNLDTMELLVLVVICVITVVTSVFTINDGIKKHTVEDFVV